MGRTSRGRCASLLDGFLASAAECGAARNKENRSRSQLHATRGSSNVSQFTNSRHESDVCDTTTTTATGSESIQAWCMCEKNIEQARTFPVRIVNTYTHTCVCVYV